MIQEPAEPFLAGDRSCGWLRASTLDPSVHEALVASLNMVVFHTALHRSPDVLFSEKHHAIKALRLDREGEALCVCVGLHHGGGHP